MSNLQQLLDEKFPLAGLDKQDTYVQGTYRKAFTEGYNAAKAEANTESDKRQALQYLNSRKPIDDTKF